MDQLLTILSILTNGRECEKNVLENYFVSNYLINHYSKFFSLHKTFYLNSFLLRIMKLLEI